MHKEFRVKLAIVIFLLSPVSSLQTDVLLQEKHFGVYEGTTYEAFKEAAAAAQPGGNYLNFTPEGGESLQQLTERTVKFMQVCA